MNQQGLLAEKKREGRCSGDYFFFTVCEDIFSGFIKALDLKGIHVKYAKKVITLRLQVSLSLRDK